METALWALKTELGLQHGGHNLDSSPAQGTKEVCTRAPGLGSLLLVAGLDQPLSGDPGGQLRRKAITSDSKHQNKGPLQSHLSPQMESLPTGRDPD